jgi:hypothetical protein
VTADKLPKKPLIRDIPRYGQHNNGCGLASLMMLLDVPKNLEIKDFLNDGWHNLEELFKEVKYKRDEFYWAIVLQYILLKSVGYTEDDEKESIYAFFMNRIEYVFEDQRIINKFNQEAYRTELLNKKKLDEAFLFLHYLEGHDYVVPYLLMRNIHTMKTDIELKILAEIFNYEFVYQESEDMTGALYFTKNQLKKPNSEEVQKKWENLENWANNPDAFILYGKYHHWLAIRGVYRLFQLEGLSIDNPSISAAEKDEIEKRLWNPKEILIDVNDPASMTTVTLNFTHLSESDRFYVFLKRKNADYAIFKELLGFMQDDIPEEIKRYQQYTEKRSAINKAVPERIEERIKAVESKATLKNEAERESARRLVEMLQDDELIIPNTKNNDKNAAEPSNQKKDGIKSKKKK